MTWFKSATIFRLGDKPDAIQLNEQLARRPFQPCGGLDWFSEGWTPPAVHLEEPVFVTRGHMLVKLRREDKVLPAAVIRSTADAKVADLEAKELRKVGRKEKAAIKEQVTDDLLPRAFARPSAVSALIIDDWLIANTGTASRAEAVVSKLREALPPFPAALPRTNLAPHTAMTDWLAAGEAPACFALDADAVLHDGSTNGSKVSISRHDLTADEIRQHIAAGKQVTTLGLIWSEKVRFKLTDTMQLKGIQFLDVLQEEASQAGDDHESLFEATLTLMAEELRELIGALVDALGGLEDSQQHKEAA
ncbi:Recombination-associated protein RdgC [Chromobacterium vaccinii]|nr:Recombination-associated protein RdgC [Chromobacterium vaccinii]QND89791.1 Recombination-associated protein RdgC [Chromobacterium vaccinii]